MEIEFFSLLKYIIGKAIATDPARVGVVGTQGSLFICLHDVFDF